MSIVRIQHDKEKPYVMLNRASIQDPNLSWKARGLLAYLISLPDEWEVSVSHLTKVYQGNKKGNKRDAIYEILTELQEAGYVMINQSKKSKGLFGAMDYVVYETKQEPQKKEPKKEKVKKKLPLTDNPYTDDRLTVNPTQTINNDRKEIFERNDINVYPDDRSFYEQESIVSFDPETYRFPDGTSISLRMQRSIAKYSPEDRQKLQANVFYFEEQIRKGYAIKTSYEAYLQHCIKKDYASALNIRDRNRLYAQFIKEEYKLYGLNILKTVVQFKRSEKEPFESVSYSLPPETFENALEQYINKNKEK